MSTPYVCFIDGKSDWNVTIPDVYTSLAGDDWCESEHLLSKSSSSLSILELQKQLTKTFRRNNYRDKTVCNATIFYSAANSNMSCDVFFSKYP